jgi:acyl-coenzyme A thioesterase PaaI-like protein
VDLLAPAPVGTFVRVSARVEEWRDRRLVLSAVASDEEGRTLARAAGTFVRVD